MQVINDNSCAWINDLNSRSNIKVLKKNIDCDWLIIGAGYTGLSAARKLGKLHPYKKIKKNYFLTIEKSKYLSKKLIKGNNCESAMFLPIFQPLVPPNKRTNKLVNQIKKDLKKFKIKDFSYLNNILTFSDFIHIDQKSKEIVANEIYILVKEMLKDEKNCLNF